uniref:CS domain protein n=1 Tax=Toxoplasma gondii COUG TaxID=1074873 RepID=A0A2G8XRS3_TOXGO|nr:CS domain protein [Toxoplasma gondii COUG]
MPELSTADAGVAVKENERNAREEVSAATEMDGKVEEEGDLKRTASALRQSIARYGSNSYYYAHAPLPGAQQQGDVKVISGPGVVTGGPPVLLERRQAEEDAEKRATKFASPDEAAYAAASGSVPASYKAVQSYMWTDEGATVRVYVSLEKLVEPPKSGDADLCFEQEQLGTFFDDERAALAIHTNAGNYVLVLNRLYHPVDISKCRASVKRDRITLVLAKQDTDLTWFSLTKAR